VLILSLEAVSGLQTHYDPSGANRLRCCYRLTSAKAVSSHSWFFLMPR
jgi:hypothetical protein